MLFQAGLGQTMRTVSGWLHFERCPRGVVYSIDLPKVNKLGTQEDEVAFTCI